MKFYNVRIVQDQTSKLTCQDLQDVGIGTQVVQNSHSENEVLEVNLQILKSVIRLGEVSIFRLLCIQSCKRPPDKP